MQYLEENDAPVGKRERLISCFKDDSAFSLAIKALPEELSLLDESRIEALYKPTPMDYALKRQLWSRFYEVDKSGELSLKMVDVYGGICGHPHFYNYVLREPHRVAWLITPPIDTSAIIEEAFRFSFQKVRDGILNMPVTEKTAPILLKAFQIFADRHLGPIVQRIESKNLNVDMKASQQSDIPLDPHELETKLREIKAKLLPPSKDVTPHDE